MVSCGGEDVVCKELVTPCDEVASASLVVPGWMVGWTGGEAVGEASLPSSRPVTARSAPSCLPAGDLSDLILGL